LKDPTAEDHAITFPEDNLTIPLQLNGIFSFFHTRKPTFEEVKHKDPIFLTPDSDNWNPYSEHFTQNEESMLDWEGNMTPKRQRTEHSLEFDVCVDLEIYNQAVDHAVISAFQSISFTDCGTIINNEVQEFASAMSARAVNSKFSIGIGSTLIHEDSTSTLFEPIYSHIDDYSAEISSAQASKPHSLSPKFLSKIWNIKPELAKKSLKQTTQLCRQGADNDLSRQFSTNDRMLRYKRIESQFFTDTFFVTLKGKSS
jgi:hypothetical protein